MAFLAVKENSNTFGVNMSIFGAVHLQNLLMITHFYSEHCIFFAILFLMKDVLNAYVSESLLGSEVFVNCILFGSVTRHECLSDDLYAYDTRDSDKEVASNLRTIAHQNKGRFHWIDSQGYF